MANKQKQLILTEMFSSAKKTIVSAKIIKQQTQSNTLPEPTVVDVINSNTKKSIQIENPKTKALSEVQTSAQETSCSLFSGIKEPNWYSHLSSEFAKPYMFNISKFLDTERKKGVEIFPPQNQVFSAFNITPFDGIRVVLIGQDPYHDNGQAHGLCFSVPLGQPPPPSLKNIYKELKDEYPDFKIPNHGCLHGWAKQGVFMLNASLTVQAHKANSHSEIGWQRFTDNVIKIISNQSKKGVVFILWGGFAQKKEALINISKHRVIKSAHPSPLSYSRFKGCKCFTKTNDALIQLGHEPINWASL